MAKMTTPKSGALNRPQSEAVDGANAHVHYVLLADDGPAFLNGYSSNVFSRDAPSAML